MTSGLATWRAALERAAAASALAGGVALTAVALFTVGAVLADAFGAPILGDSEVVELVVGTCVFAFLPYCQMRDGHIAITIFTDRAPEGVKHTLTFAASFLMFVVAAVLTWRLIIGGLETWERERITMFLQLPLWWGYGAGAVFSVLWAVTAAFTCVERFFVREAA